MQRIRRRKVEIYPTHFDLVTLNKPLWDFVQDFRAKGGKAMIVSTGHIDNITNVMRYLGIENDIDGLLSSDDVIKSKPAPDCFLKAMKIAGVTPSETIIFEDSEIGIAAAVASGAAHFKVELEF
jgi:beta-phosphoglucomutase-like phosphatase (HAD superfamily)